MTLYNAYLLHNGHWTWVTVWDAEKFRKVEPIVRGDGKIRFGRVIMTPQQMIDACNKQIERLGENAQVGFDMAGKWGKRDTKRLFPGGPIGRIVNDFGNGRIYVFFSAKEVKEAILREITEEQTHETE